MLLLGNGSLMTRDPQNPWLAEGCVAMEGGRIVALGSTAALRARYPEAEWLDAPLVRFSGDIFGHPLI